MAPFPYPATRYLCESVHDHEMHLQTVYEEKGGRRTASGLSEYIGGEYLHEFNADKNGIAKIRMKPSSNEIAINESR